MDIGDFRVEQLSEGIFNASSGGSIEKVKDHLQEKRTSPSVSRVSASRVGLDPVLIDTGTTCVLLDAGLGMGLDKNDPDPHTSNILNNLDIFGYRPSDIKHVILSHLHYDHVAGLSFTDTSGHVCASLPNARIYVQKKDWEAALQSLDSPANTSGIGYEPDDLYRLVADGRFVFLEKERQEILKGITIIRTGGHTPGHQITRIRNNKKTATYFGDLIPNEFYMNHYRVNREDTDSIKARKAKTLLIQQAWRDQATLLFYHSVFKKTGKITRDTSRRFVLKSG